MSLDLANQLIHGLGMTMGIQNLCLDDQGYCCLQIDSLDIHLQFENTHDSLILFARLGELEEDALQEGCVWMMNANLFWAGTNGATLALQGGSNHVFLQNRIAVIGVQNPAFERWISEFLSAADRWIGSLAQMNAGDPMRAPQAAEAPMMPGDYKRFV